MYLTADVAASLVGRMTAALVPGGFLFLGHTDSLGSAPPGLELRSSHSTFYYRRAGVPAVTTEGQGGLMDVVLHPRFAQNRSCVNGNPPGISHSHAAAPTA